MAHAMIKPFIQKTIPLPLLCTPALAGILLGISACAPDPTLQKEMEENILTAAEREQVKDVGGPQFGQDSRGYGYGGF